MSDFDNCADPIHSFYGINQTPKNYSDKHRDDQEPVHTAVAEVQQTRFGRFVNVSATRFIRSLNVQQHIGKKSAARTQRRHIIGYIYDALNEKEAIDDALAHDVGSQARIKLYARQVRGFDASRSIMTSAGVTHHMSDTVRVIKSASAREHKIMGVDYQNRSCPWLEMLEMFGQVIGSGSLRQLCAGAILADFVLFDSERAPQPDDVDFDCLDVDNRIAFLRLIDQRHNCKEIAADPIPTSLLIDTEAIAERYAEIYRQRIPSRLDLKLGSHW